MFFLTRLPLIFPLVCSLCCHFLFLFFFLFYSNRVPDGYITISASSPTIVKAIAVDATIGKLNSQKFQEKKEKIKPPLSSAKISEKKAAIISAEKKTDEQKSNEKKETAEPTKKIKDQRKKEEKSEDKKKKVETSATSSSSLPKRGSRVLSPLSPLQIQTISKQVRAAWLPPPGMSKETSATLHLFINKEGKVEVYKFIRSSGVPIFDISVKEMVKKLSFEKKIGPLNCVIECCQE